MLSLTFKLFSFKWNTFLYYVLTFYILYVSNIGSSEKFMTKIIGKI